MWGGYAGGDAPGVKFENCYWCQEKEIAAICTDTWGVEVRPNETTEANQPWHWVVIPAMGLCMGEIFYLKELAEDCENDGIYEFFFCGPPLIITGGTGSPINPQAIKWRPMRAVCDSAADMVLFGSTSWPMSAPTTTASVEGHVLVVPRRHVANFST